MQVLVWLVHEVRAFQIGGEQLARLRARFPEHEFVPCRTVEELRQRLPEAHAALVWRFDAAWYREGPKLEFVATPAAGRERLAPDPAGRCRALYGAFHGKIMAETLLGMMLFWSRRFDLALGDRRARRYDRDQFSPTRRLAERTALIVGYGALGRECAARLKPLGMRVIGVKRRADVAAAPADEVRPVAELESLLASADHVIATLPSDTGTDHLFDARAFAAMPAHAFFYNLGRGNAVDETALVRALAEGRLAGAFLDVFEREPLPADSPLWDTQNLEFLPHASAIHREYLDLWFDELTPELEALGRS
jgi:D-2-hydroxyacid dehydrogenase (NADP+)